MSELHPLLWYSDSLFWTKHHILWAALYYYSSFSAATLTFTVITNPQGEGNSMAHCGGTMVTGRSLWSGGLRPNKIRLGSNTRILLLLYRGLSFSTHPEQSRTASYVPINLSELCPDLITVLELKHVSCSKP